MWLVEIMFYDCSNLKFFTQIKERRPTLATDEKDLRKAEKWRNQVIREIAKKVTQIQNGKLSSLRKFFHLKYYLIT